MTEAGLVVLGSALATVGASWAYFRRYRVTRPPIGVFNERDLAVMIGGIIAVPYLYLALPVWLVGALLGLSSMSVLALVAEPILRERAARWAFTGGLLAADLGAAWALGTTQPLYLAINDGLIGLLVVGITNLWAQSGMQARAVAFLGAVLTVYDLTATTLLPLMGQMMGRPAGLPLGPQLAWASGSGGLVLIGLGDLLMAAVFPLVMRRAYGAVAGRLAVAVAAATLVSLFLLPISTLFPVMVILGPLMVVQYFYWSHRGGPERTTGQYWQAEAASPAAPATTQRGTQGVTNL